MLILSEAERNFLRLHGGSVTLMELMRMLNNIRRSVGTQEMIGYRQLLNHRKELGIGRVKRAFTKRDRNI